MAHRGSGSLHCGMLVRAYLEKVFVALQAELVSEPKRNDNMPNEFVISQSCSRMNAARKV
jgi:hypothetical protein